MLLRGILSQNWVKQLSTVTNSLNDTPIKRLGWLKPNNIHSEADSALVDNAKRQSNITILKEPTYSEQRNNSNQYDGDLKISDYVYKQYDSKVFDKSFDVSVN